MQPYFEASSLALCLALLMVALAGATISFSSRYLEGERDAATWQRGMLLLIASGLGFVFSQHVILILSFWFLTTSLLIRLLSGSTGTQSLGALRRTTQRTLGAGSACLALALFLLASASGAWTLPELAARSAVMATETKLLAGILVLIAAMTQSALFPFHRWLMQSLLAPTPFSALLHAGIVSAGGILLIRFAWLFSAEPWLQALCVIAGSASVLLGGLSMRTQSEVKRALLCSTTTQMGFMVLQCGLGLYAVALCHLALHGLYKASLFLGSGTVLETAEAAPQRSPGLAAVCVGLVGTFLLTGLFVLLTGKHLTDASMPLVLLVAWASYLFAQEAALRTESSGLALLASLGLALPLITLYAFLVTLAEGVLGAQAPGPLTWVHALGIVVCLLASASRLKWVSYSRRLYMWALNSTTATPTALVQLRSRAR